MSAEAPQDRPNVPAAPAPARFIVMASAPIAVGFGLLGVEWHADPTPDQLEQLLEELVDRRQSALVFVEEKLARGEGRWSRHVRDQSCNILLVELPPLHVGPGYRSAIDERIAGVLGSSSLEPTNDGG